MTTIDGTSRTFFSLKTDDSFSSFPLGERKKINLKELKNNKIHFFDCDVATSEEERGKRGSRALHVRYPVHLLIGRLNDMSFLSLLRVEIHHSRRGSFHFPTLLECNVDLLTDNQSK